MKLLDRIATFLGKLLDEGRPSKVQRVCYSCWQQYDGRPFYFDGRPYCSERCVPAVFRAQDRREADRLDLARKAGL